MANETLSPSPQEVLDALQLHLEPTPVFPTLPSALRLFAHLGLVAERTHTVAAKALADGFKDEVLKRCAKERSEKIMGLSMVLREEHLRRVLAQKKANLDFVQKGMLDVYFPATDDLSKHAELFVRVMADHAGGQELLAQYRAVVQKWIETRQSGGTVEADAGKLERLAAAMMSTSRQVVADAKDLEVWVASN